MDSRGGRHEPVNLGNPVEFTIRELAEEVAKDRGRRDPGDPSARCRRTTPPSASRTSRRAREWLAGWEPRMQLAEGLVRTVAYFRRRLQRKNRSSIPTVDEELTSPRLLD